MEEDFSGLKDKLPPEEDEKSPELKILTVFTSQNFLKKAFGEMPGLEVYALYISDELEKLKDIVC